MLNQRNLPKSFALLTAVTGPVVGGIRSAEAVERMYPEGPAVLEVSDFESHASQLGIDQESPHWLEFEGLRLGYVGELGDLRESWAEALAAQEARVEEIKLRRGELLGFAREGMGQLRQVQDPDERQNIQDNVRAAMEEQRALARELELGSPEWNETQVALWRSADGLLTSYQNGLLGLDVSGAQEVVNGIEREKLGEIIFQDLPKRSPSPLAIAGIDLREAVAEAVLEALEIQSVKDLLGAYDQDLQRYYNRHYNLRAIEERAERNQFVSQSEMLRARAGEMTPEQWQDFEEHVRFSVRDVELARINFDTLERIVAAVEGDSDAPELIQQVKEFGVAAVFPSGDRRTKTEILFDMTESRLEELIPNDERREKVLSELAEMRREYEEGREGQLLEAHFRLRRALSPGATNKYVSTYLDLYLKSHDLSLADAQGPEATAQSRAEFRRFSSAIPPQRVDIDLRSQERLVAERYEAGVVELLGEE